MSVSEPFTVITSKEHAGPGLFDEYRDYNSAKLADQDVQLTAALRTEHPELIVTTVPTYNLDLLQFAAAGYAEAELDLKGESIMRLRGFIGPRHRGASGSLAEAISFAKYRYRWSNEDFIVYTVGRGYSQVCPGRSDGCVEQRPSDIPFSFSMFSKSPGAMKVSSIIPPSRTL